VVSVSNTRASGHRAIILKAAEEMLPIREATEATAPRVTGSTLW
jgi:hypothetical protein